MKSFIKTILFLGVANLNAQTTKTPTELHLRADVDADGRQDLVIVERATGSFRIGYQLSEGQLTWSHSRASGAVGASWIARGNLSGDAGSFVIAAPIPGFVSVCAAPAGNSPVVPLLVYPQGIGPSGVIAADLGGAGNTSDDDLIVLTGLDGHQRELLRHTGGGVESYISLGTESGAVFQAGERTVIEDDGEEYVALLEGAESGAVFQIFDASEGAALVEKASAGGLPGSGFVSGKFSVNQYHQFIFWEVGQDSVAWRQSGEVGQGNVQFSGSGAFSTGFPVGQIVVVAGGVAPRLLVISEDGSTAGVFNFDGAAASLVEQFDAPQGRSFTGAFAGTDGDLTLLHGVAGSGLSSSWIDWNVDGQGYGQGSSGDLPLLIPAGTRANVFLFATEPFVSPDPGLLATLNAPEWSSDVSVTGNPKNVSALTEFYGGELNGLGSVAPHPLGSAPEGANFALGNQLRDDTSLGSLQHRLGATDLQVKISPAGGVYDQAVTPVVSGLPATLAIFARVNGGAWTPAEDFDPYLTVTSEIQFYGQVMGGNRRTPIHSVTYTFEVDANLLDSDRDGVPDFVEQSWPENSEFEANSGPDTDLDGFSDLEELLADTDPLDPEDKPDQHLPNSNAFVVRGQLQPVDGTTGIRTTSGRDVEVEILSPEGKRLGATATRLAIPGFGISPAFQMDRIFTDSPLLSVLSEPVFDIETPDVEKARGRELAALMVVPQVPMQKISYVPGGGTISEEVTAWKAAASAAVAASQPIVVSKEITERDVLVSLLFESWLNRVANARGLSGVTSDNVRLFPSRPSEAAQRILTGVEMEGLRVRLGDSLPGWDVVSVFSEIESALGLAGATELRSVATEIYRISSDLGVGQNAPDFRPPLDVLREFVRGGSLPAAYEGASQVSPADRALAFQQATTLLAGLTSRPVSIVDLEVTANTFSEDCPLLNQIGSVNQFSLLSRQGLAYQFPPGFTLVEGVELRVVGHTDLSAPDCSGRPLEVLGLSMTHLPTPPLEDVDENLLNDAWEDFFSMISEDPLGDSDGDGFSNLQEMLDGTDPLLAESKGSEPANLGPPQVKVLVLEGGEIVVEWDYPPAYADQIVFTLSKSTDLQSFAQIVPDVSDQGGHFEVTLPDQDEDQVFFQVSMSLKK